MKQLLQSGADGVTVRFSTTSRASYQNAALLHEIVTSAPAHVRKLGLLTCQAQINGMWLRDATRFLDGQLPHLEELQLSFAYLDTLEYFRKLLAKRVGAEVVEVRKWCIPSNGVQGEVDVTVRCGQQVTRLKWG